MKNKVTEEEKNKALEVLLQYEIESNHNIRDCVQNDCPSKDFEQGEPNAYSNANCNGDGHYLCKECVYYNSRFK